MLIGYMLYGYMDSIIIKLKATVKHWSQQMSAEIGRRVEMSFEKPAR